MKKNLLLASIFLSHTLYQGSGEAYICNNNKTEIYHLSSTCRGLSNCQHKIIKMSIEAAKKKGMKLCGWEGKKGK